jgi:Na+/alanine symporter
MDRPLSSGMRIVFWLHIAAGIVFGLAFLLIPEQSMELYAWQQTIPFVFTRVVGAAILALAYSSWLALQANAWQKVRIVVQMEIFWATLLALTLVWELAAQPTSLLLWVNVILMAGFAFFFTYFFAREELRAAQRLSPQDG